jgi:hypothetical protein
MQLHELIVFLLFIAVIWYWMDGMRAKEIARNAGRQACDNDGVAFLDDTVVLEKVGLRRSSRGNMAIFRQYQFEFSSDGSCRYKGNIELLSKQVMHCSLEAHRVPPGF